MIVVASSLIVLILVVLVALYFINKSQAPEDKPLQDPPKAPSVSKEPVGVDLQLPQNDFMRLGGGTIEGSSF